MARTSQAPKPRYDDLGVHTRRDLFVGWRDAAGNRKKDLERPKHEVLIAAMRLHDSLNDPDVRTTDEDLRMELDAEESTEYYERLLRAEFGGPVEYPSTYTTGEDGIFGDDGERWCGDYCLDTEDEEPYGDVVRSGGAFVLLTGGNPASVFGEGFLGGNPGFSVKSRP